MGDEARNAFLAQGLMAYSMPQSIGFNVFRPIPKYLRPSLGDVILQRSADMVAQEQSAQVAGRGAFMEARRHGIAPEDARLTASRVGLMASPLAQAAIGGFGTGNIGGLGLMGTTKMFSRIGTLAEKSRWSWPRNPQTMEQIADQVFRQKSGKPGVAAASEIYGLDPAHASELLAMVKSKHAAVEATRLAQGQKYRLEQARQQEWLKTPQGQEMAAYYSPSAIEARGLAEVSKSPISAYWAKNKKDDVLEAIRLGTNHEMRAREATLEAIVRRARQLGWEVGHSSTGSSGRLSSRYVIVPGKGKVRLSDHELPETPQREHMRNMGMRGSWVDEVIVDDWRTMSIDDYMKRLQQKE